MKETNEPFH